ncbi:fimbrial protein [Serratia silvae]|uniref:Type 1 fimbrial protein n=1 Tax=Serratia silvae TaxID=2824122 RepID=A0ABT0KDN8_9GAMM|nr:fimbrial protein [Serratia silvae]MCL1030135.1 type 1 fimbrial protein [Serratia silvae]
MDINKLFKTTALCLALGGMGISGAALANQATLHITGTVKASPCVIDTDDANKTVPLGDIQASNLFADNSHSGWADFTITLKDCPAATNRVVATFSGTPADENPNMYKNDGDADSVQIELVDKAETLKLGKGATMKVEVGAITPKQAIYNLRARAYSTAGNVTPGSISAAVTIGFVYEYEP